MTTKERRLVFVYSKMCDVRNTIQHCVSLLTCDKYDSDLAADETINGVRNGLANLEVELDSFTGTIEGMVNKTTVYDDDAENGKKEC